MIHHPPPPAVRAKAAKTPALAPRTIAISVNGESVAAQPPPIVDRGRLFIPLRSIMGALGLEVVKSGDRLAATLPTGRIDATVGSSRVLVNDRPVMLDAPIRVANGTTYVPLRYVSAAVGAVVAYDQRAASVQIVSAFVGRNAAARQMLAGGGSTLTGTADNVDTGSNPRTLTLIVNGDPRVIAVDSAARVTIEDATDHASSRANLDDIVPGDALRVLIRKDGRVVQVDDFFASRAGRLAAVSANAVVLSTGRVVAPGSNASVTLDGAPARTSDLRVGDFVTVRSNPETGEIRQVIASRAAATGTPAPSGPVAIAGFAVTASRPLRAGERFSAILHGTPHGRASFDLGDAVTGIAMSERTAGTYAGSYAVPSDLNLTQVPVFGQLQVGDRRATRVQAEQRVSISTTPPVIGDVAPSSGQTVNAARPSLYATFASPSEIGIDPSSVRLRVNGRDVTASATRSDSYVTYAPPVDYPDGTVSVEVRVADLAGNTATRTWTFGIRAH